MATTILNVLEQAQGLFSRVTDSPSLDAELLLAHLLNCSRAELHTWPDREVPADIAEKYLDLCQQHVAGVPMAYLLGEQGFWKFNLHVTPDVLIPRPDTELLVETALSLFSQDSTLSVVDLGTGSGAIALALAYERPLWEITAVDTSENALTVAQKNANKLNLGHIHWQKGDWFSELAGIKFNLIVANPPYIAPDDPHLADLQHEPVSALVAHDDGLGALKQIISEANHHLFKNGYLVLEHGYNQGEAVQELLKAAGFIEIQTFNDLGSNPRVTLGKKP